jgi:hypothetical protein
MSNRTQSDTLRVAIDAAISESQTRPRVVELPYTPEIEHALLHLSDDQIYDDTEGLTTYRGKTNGKPWEIATACPMRGAYQHMSAGYGPMPDLPDPATAATVEAKHPELRMIEQFAEEWLARTRPAGVTMDEWRKHMRSAMVVYCDEHPDLTEEKYLELIKQMPFPAAEMLKGDRPAGLNSQLERERSAKHIAEWRTSHVRSGRSILK